LLLKSAAKLRLPCYNIVAMQIKFYDCDEKGRMQSTLHIHVQWKDNHKKGPNGGKNHECGIIPHISFLLESNLPKYKTNDSPTGIFE
ncbi:MAG: hypothetical protein PUB62_09940, partial [Prevotellaceae bacterium]|nr:hypothetical protein [Prevotellaceae bacterium]